MPGKAEALPTITCQAVSLGGDEEALRVGLGNPVTAVGVVVSAATRDRLRDSPALDCRSRDRVHKFS